MTDINHPSSSSSCCRHQEISQVPTRQRRTADDRQQTIGRINNRCDKSPRSSNRAMVLFLVATSVAGIILQMVVFSHVTVEASAFAQQQHQILRPSKTYALRPDYVHARTTAARPFTVGQKQGSSTQVMMSRIRGGTIGSGGGNSFGRNGITSDNNLGGSPSSSRSRLAVSSSIMGPTTDHRQENQQQQQQPQQLQLQDQQQYPPSSSTLTTKMKNHRTLLLLLAVSTPVLLGTLTVHQNFVVSGITSLFASYRNALIDHPLTSKVLTGATLAIIGDFVAQYTTWSSSSASASSAAVGGTEDFSYDKRRAVSFAVFDACYRVFQNAMFPAVIGLCKGNILKHLLPVATTRVAAAIERTLLYQLVIVPTLYYPVFFIFTGFIQGLSLKETLQRMKSNYFKCWGRNLQVRAVIRPS